ncbi:MAG TPA: glycerol-3-phosphate responsive antiterminator [Phycisphaerae bacterium]|nr:glycerol-3-phosphate responsive antiterminator [Phycisphaerae bacterium]HRY67558.1 glycerol-3-phosphate responsive antiterminator [Phycisphaerae bacterium]HSA24945.1 glycerol-3-phosphate responsive antiterminator [Phycisphaerae bacterium]
MKKDRRHQPIERWFARPIIPVVWDIGQMDCTSLAQASLVFLQGGELAALPGVLEVLTRPPLADIPVMLHIDLLAGLTSDEPGLRYLVGHKRIDGIITVRSHLIAAARRMGLAAILRLFLQDGRAVDRGLHIIEQAHPDVIELIPGVAAIETAAQFSPLPIPRIAGGLVRSADLAQRILASGCRAVSTSNEQLWNLNTTS